MFATRRVSTGSGSRSEQRQPDGESLVRSNLGGDDVAFLSTSTNPENMILVMGVTGSGKSFFINKLKQNSVVEGHDLRSRTKTCEAVQISIGTTVVTVVDTPGFDDDEDSDGETLVKITQFLTTQYRLGISLKGIIYLHKINDNRISGSGKRYIEIFNEICGNEALRNVALVTTMWKEVDLGTGLQRDQQLRDDYWDLMVSNGSYVFQFNGSPAMAETIIGQLLTRDDVVLKIQHELSDNRQRLDKTSAGVIVTSALEERLGERGKAIRSLSNRLKEAERNKDKDEQRRIRKQLERQRTRYSKQKRARGELHRHIDIETDEKIKEVKEEKRKKKLKWKSRAQLFAAVLGPLVMLTVQIILPLAGVAV